VKLRCKFLFRDCSSRNTKQGGKKKGSCVLLKRGERKREGKGSWLRRLGWKVKESRVVGEKIRKCQFAERRAIGKARQKGKTSFRLKKAYE